jgi:alpha-beta hydrolase superfamily lysophospholipase
MTNSEYTLKMSDGVDIQVYEWLPDKPENIKAILQIAHGMAEHASRYSNFAEFMVSNNFAVYANDHRGHGKTAGSLENVGFIAPKNGWNLMVNDFRQISLHIKKKHTDKALYVFGHSMGSFIVRNFIANPGIKIEGAILSGTGGNPGLLGQIGVLLTKLIMLFYPAKSPSPFMDRLSFGKFNNAFKPNRTKFDWLSRDNIQVYKYIDDPFCGTIFSIGFFNNLLNGLNYVSKQKTIDLVAEDVALLIFSGEKDPVGNNGKGVTEVYNKFKKAGIKNVTLKLFPNARHEMLNETNNLEVYQFILDWLKKN